MTTYDLYWLISKGRRGFSMAKVEGRLTVHFNGRSAVIKLGDSQEEIPVQCLYKDEEEPNYFPSPCFGELDEKLTYTWIDIAGGRIFCMHNKGFAEDIFNTLLIKGMLDEFLKSGGGRNR